MAEGKYDNQNGIAALEARLAELERENLEIKRSLNEAVEANALSSNVQKGFENVIAELRPLRNLAPERESLEEPVAEAVAAMLKAMKGVTLTGDSLGIPEINVPFIGEPRPDPSDAPYPGGTPLPSRGQPDPYKGPGKTTTKQALGGGHRP